MDNTAQQTDLLQMVAKPDVGYLSVKYPELRKYLRGTWVDFTNIEASYLMTTVLLNEYFNLDVVLDRSHLCPRIANRLEYVLWIKELVDSTLEANSMSLVGIDIGVGASCIYPILVCSVWSHCQMYGTDINPESIAKARENLQRNDLESRISLIQTSDDSKLLPTISMIPQFTMCNPPFYSSPEEMRALRAMKQQNPYSELQAVDSELFTAGGEMEFTMKLVDESMQLRGSTWYSTMVGKKSTLERLVEKLQKEGIINYALHEISPGSKTRRWTIAWNFTAFHPRNITCRVIGTVKHLNRRPTEILCSKELLNVDRATNCLTILFKALEPGLVWTWDGKFAKIKCWGDVWSRSYRRRRSEPAHEPDRETRLQVELCDVLDGKCRVNAWWEYGWDYHVFESFCGLLNRHLRTESND
jgi:23S rRNA (adenine1618-N6)-methyltransferase